MNGRQDMRRIGPLPTARFEEALLAEEGQHRLEEEQLGRAVDQAGTKLTEHGGIEAGIGQGQGQGILPVDATADGIGSLAVGQAFGELHHGNEGQLGRGFRRLAGLRKQVRELGIDVDGTKGVAHAHIRIAFREGGMGHAGRFVRDTIADGRA